MSPKHDSAKPIATKILPRDGACVCISSPPCLGAISCALSVEDDSERGDDRGERRLEEHVHEVRAADREVDAAVEAVAVLVFEHRVGVVAEPGGEVEVALVAPRRAWILRTVGVE